MDSVIRIIAMGCIMDPQVRFSSTFAHLSFCVTFRSPSARFVVDPQAYLRRPKFMVEFLLTCLLVPVELHLWGGGVPWTASSATAEASVTLVSAARPFVLPFRALVFMRMMTHVKSLTLL